jgi:hypothetical protein
MSRGGENSPRQKRRWFLRSRRGTEFSLSRKKNPLVLFPVISRLTTSLCGSQGNALGRGNSRRFWRREFSPPLDNGRGSSVSRLIFSTAALFQRGKTRDLHSNSQKAPLPLKQGGREGFLGSLFKTPKCYALFLKNLSIRSLTCRRVSHFLAKQKRTLSRPSRGW